MLLGPGALPRLRNLTILMSQYQSQYRPRGHDHHPCPIGNHWGPQEVKIFIVILYELIDLIEVV